VADAVWAFWHRHSQLQEPRHDRRQHGRISRRMDLDARLSLWTLRSKCARRRQRWLPVSRSCPKMAPRGASRRRDPDPGPRPPGNLGRVEIRRWGSPSGRYDPQFQFVSWPRLLVAASDVRISFSGIPISAAGSGDERPRQSPSMRSEVASSIATVVHRCHFGAHTIRP
jgi:hypothetical protein